MMTLQEHLAENLLSCTDTKPPYIFWRLPCLAEKLRFHKTNLTCHAHCGYKIARGGIARTAEAYDAIQDGPRPVTAVYLGQ